MGFKGLPALFVSIVLIAFLTVTDAETLSKFISEKQNAVQSPLLSRHPRDVSKRVQKKSSAESFGTALHFNGAGQHLRLRPMTKTGRIELPREKLTVQFWVKPEGGQITYTPIVDLQDECSPSTTTGRWTIGISQRNHERQGARFVFSLRTDGASDTAHLFAHRMYDANIWTNVALTYDGSQMNMYINGAKISLSDEQKGPIHGKTSSKCKLLFIGGSELDGQFFRGELDELRVWNRALGHGELVENMYEMSRDLGKDPTRVLTESFADLSQWRVRPSLEPEMIKSEVPLPDHHLRFEAPPCGKTVCDDPAAMLSYVGNEQLRNEKIVKYRVVNFMEDDGTNPLLADKRITDQNKMLNKAFAPYNITFILEQLDIKNSSMRRRSVLIRCFPYMIGNGHCDEECAHSPLGNDGGDCDDIPTECDDALLGNGRCDPECNKDYHDYDEGDCCIAGNKNVHRTCIDPRSPNRGYINIDDLKLQMRLKGSGQVNIFLLTAPWYSQQFRGLATYPWEKNVYTSMGGIVMHVDAFGHPSKLNNLVHEFGHTFGLWHVHHGVSEVPCDSDCRETHPSMVLGDLCSDTNPTPRNRRCTDPTVDPNNVDEGTCGAYTFQDTPFNNYMSYADDSCIDHFTPQQVARMHCYLDLVYQPMREMKKPSPVPLAPKVVEADDTSVRIVWLEPLGTDSTCDSYNRLYQFADVATSSHSGVRWSPQEATGFPDAVHCFPSFKAWMPHYWDEPVYCEPYTCWLELGFRTPVVPSRLTVWVADLKSETELSVEMISIDGYSVFAGNLPAYCDMEASLVVKTKKRIEKVRIYTSHKHVAIDAVQMVSRKDFPQCTRRRRPKYRLHREPDFHGGYMLLGDPHYTDRNVESGVTYTYSVQTLIESRTSVTSPSLTYQHGQPFCGDGRVTNDEECDDRNSIDGDGCNIACLVEEGFRCKGTPSLCYIHHGDGVCENFEKEDNINDCGLYTPDGFFDQWAFSAIANPKYQKPECPPSAVTGTPDLQQKCSSPPVGSNFWRPCREYGDVTGSFWIQVTMYRPVVAVSVLIFLASDGVTEYNQEQKYIHVALVTERDDLVDLQPTAIPVRCRDSPVQVNVMQDISLPFFLTKGVRISFTYSSISIASVGVRSSYYINPAVIRSCRKSELYNPRSGTCVDQTCNTRTCGAFPVKYGEAVCTGDREGDTCHIQCETGYFVDGHMNKAVCADGQWMTSSPLVCSPLDCGRLVVEHATVNCRGGTTYPQQCQFKCDKPARLSGTDTSVQCQANGVWSELKARCDIRCDPLDGPLFHGSILKTPGCASGLQLVGQQCKIRCGEGYHVDGERSKRRVLRLLCDESGLWDGPDCVPSKCDPLPVIFTGAYTCTDEFYSGSTCTMNCPDNLNSFMTVTCQSEGDWDKELTICPSDATKTCDVMPQKEDVIFNCVDSQVAGKCSVTCVKRDHVPVYRRRHHADDVMYDVDKVTCTVLQKWEPDPGYITCEPKCQAWEIGDGFCDAVNNRDVCRWDDGDCCESTVVGGIVTPLPEDCMSACKCKDPEAAENKRRQRRHKFRKPPNMFHDDDDDDDDNDGDDE